MGNWFDGAYWLRFVVYLLDYFASEFCAFGAYIAAFGYLFDYVLTTGCFAGCCV